MTKEEDKGSRAIKVSTFDGDNKKFQLFWICFRAHESVSGFFQCLSSTEGPDLPDQEDAKITGDDATSNAQRKGARLNVMAI
eukprot:5146976-Ditylum_brightwellii.AAC.2